MSLSEEINPHQEVHISRTINVILSCSKPRPIMIADNVDHQAEILRTDMFFGLHIQIMSACIHCTYVRRSTV